MQRTGTAQLHAEELRITQEAAVLYAANHADAAASLLEGAIGRDPAASDMEAWLMLHELHHAAGRKEEFDALGERFCRAFRTSARPPWGSPRPIDAPGTFAMKGVVTSSSAELAPLLQHAAGRKTLAIDMAEVQRIDFASAAGFVWELRNFNLGGKRVILANVSRLNAALLEALGADHHAVVMRQRVAPEREASIPAARPAPAVAIAHLELAAA